MRKSLVILAAWLLPATLCAQSALHQLESLAGMSIHDVPIPAVPDPTPVNAEEEESEEQQYIFNMHESKPDKCAQNKD